MLSGDNGILQKATTAKENTDSAQIKERVRLAYNSALTKDLTSGNGDLTKPTLDEEINKEFGSSGKVEKDGDEWVIYVDNNEIERISIPESALKPTLISQGAKVGDYVNYNAASGNGANLQVTVSDISEIVQTIANTNDDTKFAGGATISGTFKSNDITKWRIISTENGIIKLMGESPTVQTVTLQGVEGFKKSTQILDKISSIYGEGDGAISAKSITLDDLDLNYNNIYRSNNLNTEYTSGKFLKQIIADNKVIGYEDSITEATSENKVTMRETGFGSGGPSVFNNSDIWYDMYSYASGVGITGSVGFFINSLGCWANSGSTVAGFGLWDGYSGAVSTNDICFNSDGSYQSCTRGALPVITLKTDIRGDKNSEKIYNNYKGEKTTVNVWNLDV